LGFGGVAVGVWVVVRCWFEGRGLLGCVVVWGGVVLEGGRGLCWWVWWAVVLGACGV